MVQNDFDVRAVDGTGRTFTDNEGSSVAGGTARQSFCREPYVDPDGRNGTTPPGKTTIPAMVAATGDASRSLTSKGRSTKLDEPTATKAVCRHDGVDALNRALFNRDFDAGPHTRYATWTVLHGCCAKGLTPRAQKPPPTGGGFVVGLGKASAYVLFSGTTAGQFVVAIPGWCKTPEALLTMTSCSSPCKGVECRLVVRVMPAGLNFFTWGGEYVAVEERGQAVLETVNETARLRTPSASVFRSGNNRGIGFGTNDRQFLLV